MEFRFPDDIDLTPEDALPLAAAIGSIVLAWGTAEASLNMIVAMIFQSAGGRHHAKDEEIPVALKRKLRFLRLCFRRIAVLEPFREQGLALVERTSSCGNARNDLVHSFLSEVDRKTGTFVFTGLGSVKDQPVITGQVRYTIPELMQLQEKILLGASDLADFAKRLAQTFVP